MLMCRAIICALSLVLMTANVQGQTEKNAAFLVEQCQPLAVSDSSWSKSDPRDIAKMTYCVGFLDALIASLERNHDLYRTMFPDPKVFQTDKAAAGRLMATMLLIGPDVCFPAGITPKIAALIIEKYGRDHPEQLTDNPQKFANLAFADAYPAVSNGSYLCK
jgi:Rap1a immunity proteins